VPFGGGGFGGRRDVDLGEAGGSAFEHLFGGGAGDAGERLERGGRLARGRADAAAIELVTAAQQQVEAELALSRDVDPQHAAGRARVDELARAGAQSREIGALAVGADDLHLDPERPQVSGDHRHRALVHVGARQLGHGEDQQRPRRGGRDDRARGGCDRLPEVARRLRGDGLSLRRLPARRRPDHGGDHQGSGAGEEAESAHWNEGHSFARVVRRSLDFLDREPQGDCHPSGARRA